VSTTELSARLPEHKRLSIVGLATSTDHKTIGLMTVATAFVFFAVFGAFALTMRADLASSSEQLISTHLYNELFTLHGSGMIYLVVTPLALGLGVYIVPLQIGAPGLALPRTAQLAYYSLVLSGLVMLSGFLTYGGAADTGWYSYEPLSDLINSPGKGMDLWIAGVFLAGLSGLLYSVSILWTIVRMRAPRMSMLRLPVFVWSEVVTCLMGLAAFPSLIGAMCLQTLGRLDPRYFSGHDLPNLNYQNLFWFYGHPVVYIMFFPFVGCVAEVLQTFGRRRYVGYKPTVLSLLAFAALSMSVWGHHMFTTGQESNEYFSATSTALSVPAGIEYFGFLATIIGAKLRFKTPLLFALAFIPQFLVGGLSGIMLAAPTLDYDFHGSYFVVGHFHYTLFAGSVFGLFAGFYYWFPKATGKMLSEKLGKIHFWLMVIGTNTTFGPMFALGFMGMSRRTAHYPGDLHLINLIETCGSAVIGLAMLVLIVNVGQALLQGEPAPADPWDGHTLEWATASPPPRFNFPSGLPPIKSYSPLLDWKEARQEKNKQQKKGPLLGAMAKSPEASG
jgi:cytochrome c oxidase subunit 1